MLQEHITSSLIVKDKARDRMRLIQDFSDEIRKIPRAIKAIEADTRYLSNTRIKDITRHLRDARILILDAPRKEPPTTSEVTEKEE